MNRHWEQEYKSYPRYKSKKSGGNLMVSTGLDLLEIGLRGMSAALDSITEMSGSLSPKKKHPHKDYNCCECMDIDPWRDCYSCGPLMSTTDLKLEARPGERRHLSILIENNREVSSNFSISMQRLMDVCGQTLESQELITFTPSSGTLAPCECLRIDIWINMQPPFSSGQAYYGEIAINGSCCAKTVSLGIWIKPEHLVDHLVLCDHCRPKCGRFVEFSDCGYCGPSRQYYMCCHSETPMLMDN